MTEKPHAALLRENELLRSVAAKAIRLRRIGMQCEECSEALERLWKDNPEMTRSGTQGLMLDQAFKTAMDAFDLAVLRAADEGMDWTKDHGIPKPKLF
ncbi:MAG TPA: hypothetical protein VMT72_12265, partial [Pseudolabrys sp.]|nr:hypothetical protein [Pseudolabrys sp.]